MAYGINSGLYLAEASAGTCDFIKSLAEEVAPGIANHYLLGSPDAAVEIATDPTREKFGGGGGAIFGGREFVTGITQPCPKRRRLP